MTGVDAGAAANAVSVAPNEGASRIRARAAEQTAAASRRGGRAAPLAGALERERARSGGGRGGFRHTRVLRRRAGAPKPANDGVKHAVETAVASTLQRVFNKRWTRVLQERCYAATAHAGAAEVDAGAPNVNGAARASSRRRFRTVSKRALDRGSERERAAGGAASVFEELFRLAASPTSASSKSERRAAHRAQRVAAAPRPSSAAAERGRRNDRGERRGAAAAGAGAARGRAPRRSSLPRSCARSGGGWSKALRLAASREARCAGESPAALPCCSEHQRLGVHLAALAIRAFFFRALLALHRPPAFGAAAAAARAPLAVMVTALDTTDAAGVKAVEELREVSGPAGAALLGGAPHAHCSPLPRGADRSPPAL